MSRVCDRRQPAEERWDGSHTRGTFELAVGRSGSGSGSHTFSGTGTGTIRPRLCLATRAAGTVRFPYPLNPGTLVAFPPVMANSFPFLLLAGSAAILSSAAPQDQEPDLAEVLADAGVRFDLEAGACAVEVVVTVTNDLLEYLLVAPHGAAHESLFTTLVDPEILNTALLALGVEPGSNALWTLKEPAPSDAELRDGVSPYEVTLPAETGSTSTPRGARATSSSSTASRTSCATSAGGAACSATAGCTSARARSCAPPRSRRPSPRASRATSSTSRSSPRATRS